MSQVLALRIWILRECGAPINVISYEITKKMTTIGDRIKQRRLELGWTQDKLAVKAGISKGFLSDLETDKRNVSAEYLLRIARALSVSLDFLMKGGDPKPVVSDVQIPASLSLLASEQNMPYSHILALIGMAKQRKAHRSNTKSGDLEEIDWKKFYDAVKQFLE